MSFTLYAATIPNYIQILESVARLVTKAEEFCAEHGLEPDALLQAKLADDMLPFAYQVKSAVVHSSGAIAGVRAGVFGPDMSAPPATFADLGAMVDGAIATMQAINPAEINGFVGQDMRFQFRDRTMEFLAEEFLLSFSQPNFYFHATTAYDILRMKGVAIGKRDYIGRARTKV